MSNNSKAAAKRTQVVYSEPRRIKVGTRLLKDGTTIVNVYKRNKNAKPIKEIYHPLIQGDKLTKAFNCFNKFKNR